MTKASGTFRFRRGQSVGAADAENDRKFLETCFIDNGDVGRLLDCTDARCIVVGRTGSGKTTLLLQIEEKAKGHTERIQPESLALNHITNSDTVSMLREIGVNLDPFFKLLWRQVLCIEILQHIIPVDEADKKQGFFASIMRRIRDDKSTQQKAERHKRVVKFMNEHSDNDFWKDTTGRISGMVCKFEDEITKQSDKKQGLSAELSSTVGRASMDVGNSQSNLRNTKTAVEVTVDEKRRYQRILSDMHLKDLDAILDLVAEVLEDAGQDVYILIDGLDSQWADESVRLNLIRALIDTAIAFKSVPRAKVVVAMRLDLVERVYRDARHEPGTQWEKIRDYFLKVSWDKHTLTALLDARVSKLLADHYAPNYKVTFKDIVGPTMRKGRSRGVDTLTYILDRTWMRPRDLIDFCNSCINHSTGNQKISPDAILLAEEEYSKNRIRALAEEWQLEYPFLEETIKKLLNRKLRRFRLWEMSDDQLCEWSDMILRHPTREGDKLRHLAESVNSLQIGFDDARVELTSVLYTVGAVGVQNDEEEKPKWASIFDYNLSPAELRNDSFVYVHPGLYKTLGVNQD